MAFPGEHGPMQICAWALHHPGTLNTWVNHIIVHSTQDYYGAVIVVLGLATDTCTRLVRRSQGILAASRQGLALDPLAVTRGGFFCASVEDWSSQYNFKGAVGIKIIDRVIDIVFGQNTGGKSNNANRNNGSS
jgi:hypothetical protein